MWTSVRQDTDAALRSVGTDFASTSVVISSEKNKICFSEVKTHQKHNSYPADRNHRSVTGNTSLGDCYC